MMSKNLANMFIQNRFLDRWNILNEDTVDAPNPNCFKSRLNKLSCIRITFFEVVLKKCDPYTT